MKKVENRIKISGSIDRQVAELSMIEAKTRGFRNYSAFLEWAIRAALQNPHKIWALQANHHKILADHYQKLLEEAMELKNEIY